MAYVYPIQASFSIGELSPRLHGRIDIEQYRSALHKCQNWLVLKQGGLTRRPGTIWVSETKDSTRKTRVVPFIFGTPSDGVPQAYVLEMGHQYFRPLVNGARITSPTITPSAITNANPGVVTYNAHPFANGDRLLATGIGGMTELNNREFVVANAAANTFELQGIDTSAYGAFTSGGTVGKIVEVATPYNQSNLFKLDYAQSTDTLTVAHLFYRTSNITRASDTSWAITNATFKDGPYLDEPINNVNGVTPNITGAIHPKMTANNAPSGVAADSAADIDPFQAFDQSTETTWILNNASGWLEYAPTASVICNSYWIQAPSNDVDRSPGAWKFEGWDGANWVALDTQTNQAPWGAGEIRFYSFVNAVAFSKYRLKISGNSGAAWLEIAETGWGYNGDYAPTMTLTFDTTANINDGAGFDVKDIARTIRLYGSDGVWRYFVIAGVTSTTVVTGKMYGYALPGTSKIYRWKLGTFREESWPSKVGYYESRKVFGKSIKEPYNVWLSKTFDFQDFGTSDPLVDDDGIRVRMLTGRVNSIRWIAESDVLVVGTTDNVRIINRASKNEGFGATNIEHKSRSIIGCAEVKPVLVDNVVLFVDYHGKAIRELIYDLQSDGYIPKDATILNEHLLRSGIVEIAYQQHPGSIMWIVTTAGRLVSMTYDRAQNVVGLTDGYIGGPNAVAESVCCIPGAAQDDVYLVIKRTIAGTDVRSIERLAPWFETDDDIADAVYMDSSLSYSGAATGTVTGLWHVRGAAVAVMADGMVHRGLTVSSAGALTLPNSLTAETITVGLGYSSIAETLALTDLSRDGVHLGRRAMTAEVFFSVMDSLGLKVSGLTSDDSDDVFRRDNDIDPADGAMVPRTGIFPAQFDSSWRENGQFRFFVDDPLPCTVRAVVFGEAGEP